MPRHRIRAHYEKLLEFERGRIIGLKEAAYRPLCHLSLRLAQCRVRLQWGLARSGRNHADWECIIFSDESRFQLCPDDHRRRVWRRPGQRAHLAFTITRHTGPQLEVIVWGTISFDSRTSLLVIRGPLTT
ncbi:transposable element Tc1 transposase [Trichonephila clavipes]|nr:transposable element Tc1 transposase [Trichonephila clavipes]